MEVSFAGKIIELSMGYGPWLPWGLPTPLTPEVAALKALLASKLWEVHRWAKLLEIHIVIVSRVGIYGKDFWGLDGEDLRISMISESPQKNMDLMCFDCDLIDQIAGIVKYPMNRRH